MVERLIAELERCRMAGANPMLTERDKLGAIHGEVDTLCELAMEDPKEYREELGRMAAPSLAAIVLN